MSKWTCWPGGIVVGIAGLSASAQIEVHEPGFVVDTLLDQIDGTTPRLEAIRNPQYGSGVVAASVDEGILTVWRIAQDDFDVLGTEKGLPSLSLVGTVRFDRAGVFDDEDALFISVFEDIGGNPGPDVTVMFRVWPDGEITPVGETVGEPGNEILYFFDITDGSGDYTPGAYLLDQSGGGGTSLLHMNQLFEITLLAQHILPPGRTDIDVRGMEFDPTGVYSSYLTIADSDDHDELTVMYQLLPDLSWIELTTPVSWSDRFYRDMAFSPGGSFGQVLYVTDGITDTVMSVDPDGVHEVFASGCCYVESVTISQDGEHMFVSDRRGVYRIRAATTEVGPTLVMREPWVEADDVHTGPSGVDSLRLLWSERVLFDNEDVTITNEDGQAVPLAVSGSNSQFMIIAFGEVLLNDEYTITIHDSVVSAETGAPIDGDNDGLAGGDAVLVMEHRHQADMNRDGSLDGEDIQAFVDALLAGG